jgi:hypothetical protein
VFRIGSRPDAMSMTVTVTSPRLPAPVRYVLEFTRMRPSDAPSEDAQSQ